MAELTDSELMVRFQQGNAQAFELLFQRYRGPVFNFLYRMLNDSQHVAEDMLQEVFMKVAKAREFYEPRAKFSTWLFSITRNHCLNYLRSRRYTQARSTVSIDACGGGDGASLMDTIPDPRDSAGAVERQELASALNAGILSLPVQYREVFLLRAVEGLPHGDVARILRLNPATVRTHYLRARLMLQERLRETRDPESDNRLEKER